MFNNTHDQTYQNLFNQLLAWAKGNSYHIKNMFLVDLCVPDCSCCNNTKTIKSSKEVKKRLLKAFGDDDVETFNTIYKFAGSRLPNLGKDIETVLH